MNKRFSEQCQKFIYQNQPIPLSLGTLSVVMFCLLALVIATFTQINLSHYWFLNNPDGTVELIMKKYPYVPQIPVLLGIVGVLGVRFSFLTVLLYVLMGFFLWPVFAFGGGLGYVKSTFFGHILGYFPAVIISGWFLMNKQASGMKTKFSNPESANQKDAVLMNKKSLKNILLAAFFGVLTIHICGILYSTILGIFRLVDFSYIFPTVINLTGVKICYDWLVSIAAIGLSIPLQYLLWPAMDSGVTKKITNKLKRKSNPKVSM